MSDEEIIEYLERVLRGCGDYDNLPLDENGGDQRDTGELYLKPVIKELRERFQK